MSPRVLAPLVVLSLGACDPGLKIDPPPEQLETLDAAFPPELGAGHLEGELLVVGGPRDYAFVLTQEDGEELAFEVHSSAGFDLAHLSGPDRSLELLGGEVSEHQSVVVTDESGPLWAADLGDRAAAVALHLGGGAVRAGDTVYVDQDERWAWTYKSLIVPTDEGDRELLPTEADHVLIAGRGWRFAAVAAYERRPRGAEDTAACAPLEDMVAYELFRTDTDLGPSTLERAEGEPPAELGCE